LGFGGFPFWASNICKPDKYDVTLYLSYRQRFEFSEEWTFIF